MELGKRDKFGIVTRSNPPVPPASYGKGKWSQRTFPFVHLLKVTGYHCLSVEKCWWRERLPLQDRSPWGGHKRWQFPCPAVRVLSKRALVMMQFLCSKILHGSPPPTTWTQRSRLASKPSSNQTFQPCYPSASPHVYPLWKPTQATHCTFILCLLISRTLLAPSALSSAFWKPHASVPSLMS